MKGVNFKDETGSLSKPQTMTAEECNSLPIKRTKNGKYPAIESVWELTDEELAVITKSKRIRLGIIGDGMPPVYIEAEPISDPTQPQPGGTGGKHNNQMNTTIEAVKDEVAKKHKNENWDKLLESFAYDGNLLKWEFIKIEQEVVELYHTRKCEEAGKELDGDALRQLLLDECEFAENGTGTKNVIPSLSKFISLLLASKQSQLEVKDKEIVTLNEKIERHERCIAMYAKSQPKAEIGKEWAEFSFSDVENILKKRQEHLFFCSNEKILPTDYRAWLNQFKVVNKTP